MTERRVAIVTGSSSGVGAATAELLAGKGWNVVVNYARSAAAAEAVAARCKDKGADAIAVQADIADDADCRRLADDAATRWGRIDALVNNAGTSTFAAHRDLEKLSAADFQRIYAVNVIGAYQMVRACAPHLKATARGAVVNVSSIAAVVGIGSSIAYLASKGALNSMTLALARALGPEIRVNAVCPGFIEGKWLRDGMGAEAYEAAKAQGEANNPLRAVSTPAIVAETIAWLIDGAPNITGEFLMIDGGMHLGFAPMKAR